MGEKTLAIKMAKLNEERKSAKRTFHHLARICTFWDTPTL
jgi:hypothetical protein